MSVLIDRDIRRHCGDERELFVGEGSRPMIDPFDEDQLQPASYDLLLGTVFLSIDESRLTPVDMGISSTYEDLYVRHEVERGGVYKLPAKGFVLACTDERVCISPDVVGILHGKSGIARIGQVIESAGFLDPGFEGKITMELYNQLPVPFLLRPGLPIAQVSFQAATGRPDRLYGDPRLNSHYQNDDEAVGSRYGTTREVA